MMSNKGLNSNEALEESTATNSSVILSGIRREKEAPDGLDIEHYTPDLGNSDRGGSRNISRLRHPPSRSCGATKGYGEPGHSVMSWLQAGAYRYSLDHESVDRIGTCFLFQVRSEPRSFLRALPRQAGKRLGQGRWNVDVLLRSLSVQTFQRYVRADPAGYPG